MAIAAQRWARVVELAEALQTRHAGTPAATAWVRVVELGRRLAGDTEDAAASDAGAA